MPGNPSNPGDEIVVLLIDDESDICTVWSLLLGMEGMSVVTACDGKEGLLKAMSHRPHVVICDYMMPGMNGLEVCAAIRRDEKLRDAAIVLWSAAREIDAKGLADLVVQKPVDTDTFIEHIRWAALQRRG
ncbi:response regulator transcription factor [Caballeronia arvi]|uniref:response regulator transcription factor n=1 Tax=Caballeronia arvi TaxID=1777135 RepID=UPI0007726B30|nr:response regulator [Caballeronia arvi]